MKEASWKDCTETNSAVRISPDRQRAKSLIETAEERISLIKEINKKNCNFVFEDYYTSVLEVLSKGHKFCSKFCCSVLNLTALGLPSVRKSLLI